MQEFGSKQKILEIFQIIEGVLKIIFWIFIQLLRYQDIPITKTNKKENNSSVLFATKDETLSWQQILVGLIVSDEGWVGVWYFIQKSTWQIEHFQVFLF